MHITPIDVVKMILFIAFFAVGMYLFWKASAGSNGDAMQAWIADMDVIVDNQRWRGSRSSPCYVFADQPHGLLGHRFDAMFVTHSGRFFRFRISASLSRVDAWSLEPLSPDHARSQMAISEDEMTQLCKEHQSMIGSQSA